MRTLDSSGCWDLIRGQPRRSVRREGTEDRCRLRPTPAKAAEDPRPSSIHRDREMVSSFGQAPNPDAGLARLRRERVQTPSGQSTYDTPAARIQNHAQAGARAWTVLHGRRQSEQKPDPVHQRHPLRGNVRRRQQGGARGRNSGSAATACGAAKSGRWRSGQQASGPS
jgi:hypothetical protein